MQKIHQLCYDQNPTQICIANSGTSLSCESICKIALSRINRARCFLREHFGKPIAKSGTSLTSERQVWVWISHSALNSCTTCSPPFFAPFCVLLHYLVACSQKSGTSSISERAVGEIIFLSEIGNAGWQQILTEIGDAPVSILILAF